MASANAAVFTMLLVFLIIVGEGEMASIQGNTVDREQRSPMVRVFKAPLHIMRGKRDFMNYDDLTSQVIYFEIQYGINFELSKLYIITRWHTT
jgi:hypothetical protein